MTAVHVFLWLCCAFIVLLFSLPMLAITMDLYDPMRRAASKLMVKARCFMLGHNWRASWQYHVSMSLTRVSCHCARWPCKGVKTVHVDRATGKEQ